MRNHLQQVFAVSFFSSMPNLCIFYQRGQSLSLRPSKTSLPPPCEKSLFWSIFITARRGQASIFINCQSSDPILKLEEPLSLLCLSSHFGREMDNICFFTNHSLAFLPKVWLPFPSVGTVLGPSPTQLFIPSPTVPSNCIAQRYSTSCLRHNVKGRSTIHLRMSF